MLKIFLFIAGLGAATAFGSQDQAYGLGDRSAGRAGSITAEPENPFTALSNPALLALQPHPRFGFTTASAVASFAPMRGISLVPGARTTGDYRLPDSRLMLWAAGYGTSFELPAWLDERHGGFGLALSGPYERLRGYTASTPQDFFSLRYGTSDAQFKATVSLAAEIIPDWLSVGAGLSVYIVTGGSAELAVTGSNPVGRMALDVGIRAAPVFGLYFERRRTGASLVLREAIDPVFRQTVTGTVPLGGDTILVQPLLVQSSLYYEPRLVESDVQHDFGPFTLSAGIAYQNWSRWKPAFLVAEVPDASGRVHRTQVPVISLRDTLSPRASIEVRLLGRRLTFSAGYQYRPSPVKDTAGPANPLDTDIHVAGLSFRHTVDEVEWLPFGFSWGLYAQYHWMKERAVTKAAPDSVGAPGYVISGRAYTFGASLGVDL